MVVEVISSNSKPNLSVGGTDRRKNTNTDAQESDLRETMRETDKEWLISPHR